MSKPAGQKLRSEMCKTCIFRPQGQRLEISPMRFAEIQEYLIQGQPHTCHTENPREPPSGYVCRGARNYQLQIWHRYGMITEPTDAALETAMRSLGIEPGWLSAETGNPVPDTG
jgi:hypothetical protein